MRTLSVLSNSLPGNAARNMPGSFRSVGLVWRFCVQTAKLPTQTKPTKPFCLQWQGIPREQSEAAKYDIAAIQDALID